MRVAFWSAFPWRRLASLTARAARLIMAGEFATLGVAARARARALLLKRRPRPIERFSPPAIEPDSPLVSVIIPCFNYGRFVAEAVDSALSQTLTNIEVIVVEGGSTDGETAEILRKLKRPRTRVLFQERSNLVGANRNFGISSATGRYICCLDADDTIEPTYLEKAVYLLESHRYDLVSTGIRFFGARQGTIDVLAVPTLRDMTIGNHVTTCAVFRRTLWELNGGYFDTGMGRDHVAEDWDFWLRLAAGGARIRNIAGEQLFNYRVHSGASLSSASDVRSLSEQRRQILDRRKDLLTPQAIVRSAREAARRWAAAPPGAQLFDPGELLADQRRSLLLAVPYLLIGGAERLLASVVGFLSAQGWRVTLIATLAQPSGPDAVGWFAAHTREIYMLPRFLDNWQHKEFVLYLLANHRFDALLLAGSRLVYDLLPQIEKLYPRLAVVDLLFNTHGHVVSHLKHRARITLAIGENPEVINWYRAHRWSVDRVRLIESGVDVAKFRASRPPALAEQLGVRPDDVVVGFSGRLSSEKAPETFLKIASALRHEPRLRFIMTGAGPLAERIRSEANALPAGTRLDFLGLVDDVADYFSLYDIFVLPSRVDGRPMALLEALASGCAVVASSVGGVPALIEGAKAGILCPPDDVAAFAAAISAIARDPERLNELKRRARAAAEKTLSERQTGQAYLEAIEAAIAIKRASAVPAEAVAG